MTIRESSGQIQRTKVSGSTKKTRISILAVGMVVAILFARIGMSLATQDPSNRSTFAAPAFAAIPGGSNFSADATKEVARWVGSTTLLDEEDAPRGACFVSSAKPPLYFNADGSGVEFYEVRFNLIGGSGGLRKCVYLIDGSLIDVPDGSGSFVGPPGASLVVQIHPKARPNCGASRVGEMIIRAW